MPASDRHQQPLRLPHELAARLRKQAKREGISDNAYVLRALKHQLQADEESPAPAEPRRKRDEAPAGLGLGLRRPVAPAPAPPAPPPPPVLLQVAPAAAPAPGGAPADLVSTLAAFVRSKPLFERDRHLRIARDILQAQPASEREGLLQRLDEALRDARPGRSALGGSLGSFFR